MYPFAGVILIILGLFPKLAALVASIPQPVLGGVGNELDVKKTEAVPSPQLNVDIE